VSAEATKDHARLEINQATLQEIVRKCPVFNVQNMKRADGDAWSILT
jgi:hypothetical protein